MRPSRAKITSYRPRNAPPGWEAVADQVRATVAASAPWVSYRIERLLHVVGRLAIWCHGRGLAADPEVWLRHETIDAFVLAGYADLAPRTAQTYRSWLRQVRAALAWAQRGESTPVALSAPSERTAPYTPAELARLRVVEHQAHACFFGRCRGWWTVDRPPPALAR
ncbi:hypothetical protein ACQPYK_49660 (plasmid) [Streptosporangium sp. CA-135522]|uniref:hypothetical protein n=1 Tax=Streptosporangium sp. CA-135522 TaxID=3240072 RepID=UPI003D8CA000